MKHRLLEGDSRVILRTLRAGSFDALVSDPPYELNFNAAAWDRTGIAHDPDFWREALRVLKPGAHLLAFGAPRTYHRLAGAIEDAGFEIRDSVHWLHGNGFPKSLNIETAIGASPAKEADCRSRRPAPGARVRSWRGWGTGLKPAHEAIVLARKPLEGRVAENVSRHSTGALNIDACRLGEDSSGRWPANVVIDDVVAEQLGDVSPFFYVTKPTTAERDAGLANMPKHFAPILGSFGNKRPPAPRANTHPTVKPIALMRYLVRLVTPEGGTVLDPFAGSGTTGCACALEGFDFVGIERETQNVTIGRARIRHWRSSLRVKGAQ